MPLRTDDVSSVVATPSRLRFVGLGDSLTQGVGDPSPGLAGFTGQLDGWVSHFVKAVRASGVAVDVSNFASAGARLEHVVSDQLPKALANPADIATCFIGINDLWDANLDLDAFAQRFNLLFDHLAATFETVVTSSIHDVFAPFPLRAPVRAKVNANIATMNAIIDATVHEHDLVLIDLAHRSDMFTSSVKAVDRLHPNRYGHQLIAAEVVRELEGAGRLSGVAAPVATPVRRGVQDLAHVAWVSGYVRHNWKRWRLEMAAAKAADTGHVR